MAFWLTLAGAVLFLALAAIILAADTDGLQDSVRENLVEDGTSFTEDDVLTRAKGIALISMLIALASTAPFITFGALLRRGRNWTRVLLTVAVSIGGFISVVMVFLPYPGNGLLIRVAVLALVGTAVAIVSLLFTAGANRYFA